MLHFFLISALGSLFIDITQSLRRSDTQYRIKEMHYKIKNKAMKSTIEDNTSLSAAYKKRLLSPGDVFSLLVFGPDESLERRVGLGSSESLGDIGLKHCAGATVAHLFDRGHLDIRKRG